MPKQFVLGFDSQKKDFEEFPHSSYLRGTWRDHGWWYYYLYGLLVKVPCGTLGLLALAIVRRRTICMLMASTRDEVFLLAPAIALLALVSWQDGFSIHLRYVFPSLGLILIYAAQTGQAITKSTRVQANVVSGLIAYAIVSCLLTYPNHLRYFNDFVGGSKNGYKHLLGSSYDWGQDLHKDLAWIQRHEPKSQITFMMRFPSFGTDLAASSPQSNREDAARTWKSQLIYFSADRFSEYEIADRKTVGERSNHEIVHRFPSGSILMRQNQLP